MMPGMKMHGSLVAQAIGGWGVFTGEAGLFFKPIVGWTDPPVGVATKPVFFEGEDIVTDEGVDAVFLGLQEPTVDPNELLRWEEVAQEHEAAEHPEVEVRKGKLSALAVTYRQAREHREADPEAHDSAAIKLADAFCGIEDGPR